MRFTRMDVVRVIAVAAILAAVLAAFTSPAKAQVVEQAPIVLPNLGEKDGTDCKECKTTKPDDGIQSLFHNGGMNYPLPPDSSCEACH